jgi:putative DNA methylase
MPNHALVIVEQIEGWPLASVVHSWKSFSANAVNRVLGRTGSVWMREYFDRFMRDNDHFNTAIAYVEGNPVSAGLWSGRKIGAGLPRDCASSNKDAGWKPAVRRWNHRRKAFGPPAFSRQSSVSIAAPSPGSPACRP